MLPEDLCHMRRHSRRVGSEDSANVAQLGILDASPWTCCGLYSFVDLNVCTLGDKNFDITSRLMTFFSLTNENHFMQMNIST